MLKHSQKRADEWESDTKEQGGADVQLDSRGLIGAEQYAIRFMLAPCNHG